MASGKIKWFDMVIPLTPVAFAPMESFLISLGFGGSAFSSVAKKCPCRSQRDKHNLLMCFRVFGCETSGNSKRLKSSVLTAHGTVQTSLRAAIIWPLRHWERCLRTGATHVRAFTERTSQAMAQKVKF